MTPEQRLAARARHMAAVEEPAKTGTPLALFRRLTEVYGVRLAEVAGAGRVRTMSPVPGGPGHIAGVTLHLGQLLPLVDLAALWKLPQRGVFDLSSFVVLSHHELEVGVLVEQLMGLVEVPGKISVWEGAPMAGVTGVARFEGRVVTVLSAEALLESAPFTDGRKDVAPRGTPHG